MRFWLELLMQSHWYWKLEFWIHFAVVSLKRKKKLVRVLLFCIDWLMWGALNSWAYFMNISTFFTGMEKVAASPCPLLVGLFRNIYFIWLLFIPMEFCHILLHSYWFSYFAWWVLWVYFWIWNSWLGVFKAGKMLYCKIEAETGKGKSKAYGLWIYWSLNPFCVSEFFYVLSNLFGTV